MSDRNRASGWILFASIMMFGLGSLTLLAGISDSASSSWMQSLSIFGDKVDATYYVTIAFSYFFAALAIWCGTRGRILAGVDLLHPEHATLVPPDAWPADHFRPEATAWAGEGIAHAEKRREQM